MQGTFGIGRETDWPSVASVSFGGALLWALGVAMLRRGWVTALAHVGRRVLT